MKNLVAVIIPAYNPDDKLISIVSDLSSNNLNVILVNDGSIQDCDHIFKKCAEIDGVEYLKHDVNKGKGLALKTAFDFFLNNVKFAKFAGIVCADADGQHLTKDILSVAETSKNNPKSLVIGARKFSGKVPLRSKFGNVLTKFVFKALFGNKVKDTQSGLRALPRDFMQKCLLIKGSRYEFETEMLIEANRLKIDIKNTEITTVYQDGNKSSHFNPLVDSLRIYYCFLRFIVNALSTSAIDYGVFAVCYFTTKHLLFSLILSRIVACIYNFTFSKTLVFKSHSNVLLAATKYIVLVVLFMFVTLYNIKIMQTYFGIDVYVGKVISGLGLFFLSFFIQKVFIFKN